MLSLNPKPQTLFLTLNPITNPIWSRVVKTARFFKPANREEKDRITG